MTTIVLTLAEGSLPRLVPALRAEGFAVRVSPLLTFAPPASWEPFQRAVAELERFKAIAFTSPRAAEVFRDRLPAGKHDLFGRLWAVGPGTAGRLGGPAPSAARREGESAGAALARAMLGAGVGSPVLQLHGDPHRDELSGLLRAAGVVVQEVEVYRSLLASRDEARRALQGGDLVVVASPRVMASIAEVVPKEHRRPLIALGPTTAAAAERVGWQASAVARRPTMADVIQAIQAGTRDWNSRRAVQVERREQVRIVQAGS